MAFLGRGQPGDLVSQPNQVNLDIGVPTQFTISSLIVSSGAAIPAFDSLVVNPSGTSVLALVTQGAWQGSGIAQEYGGTGLSSYTQGDILYVNGAGSIAVLPSGNEGEVLTIFAGAITWV